MEYSYTVIVIRIEARVANDEDLKLSDCLRYHMRDTAAAKVSTIVYCEHL